MDLLRGILAHDVMSQMCGTSVESFLSSKTVSNTRVGTNSMCRDQAHVADTCYHVGVRGLRVCSCNHANAECMPEYLPDSGPVNKQKELAKGRVALSGAN